MESAITTKLLETSKKNLLSSIQRTSNTIFKLSKYNPLYIRPYQGQTTDILNNVIKSATNMDVVFYIEPRYIDANANISHLIQHVKKNVIPGI